MPAVYPVPHLVSLWLPFAVPEPPHVTEVLAATFFAAAIAGVITNLLVPLLIRVAGAIQAMDIPGDGRKLHDVPIPRLGGVAMFVGIALAAGGMAMAQWGEWGGMVGRSELVALAIGTLIVFLVGLVDDLQGVSAWKRLVVETLAAGLLVRAGWQFEVLHLPFLGNVELHWLGPLLSVVWIVGVTNAINLIDGLDGLAGGVVAIIASSLLVLALHQQGLLTVLLMSSIVGACIGFLGHNWAPARIYMGDSGSLTLGFLLAVTSVHSSIKAPAAVAILVPLLALGVPVIDTLSVMAARFLERPKVTLVDRFLRMFAADRQHLHHALTRFVGRRPRIVGAIYAVVALFCALALVVALTGNFELGAWLVGAQVAVILLMRNLGMVVEARRISSQKLAELRGETPDRPVERRRGERRRSVEPRG